MSKPHTTEIRVRYQETDAQGRVHHANFINYFEIGRVEQLRAAGHSYRQLEADGIRLVVAEVEVQYHLAAAYDDLLTLTTWVESARGARIEHRYEVHRDGELLAQGRTVVACVDPAGRVQRLPPALRQQG